MMDMERFYLKKLNNSIRLHSKTSLEIWKTYRIMGTSIGHGKILYRT
jgi:hypothetical protein